MTTVGPQKCRGIRSGLSGRPALPPKRAQKGVRASKRQRIDKQKARLVGQLRELFSELMEGRAPRALLAQVIREQLPRIGPEGVVAILETVERFVAAIIRAQKRPRRSRSRPPAGAGGATGS